MQPEIFVPFLFFSFLAAVIIAPIAIKERTKRSAHDLISQAMARGQQLDPTLITQLSEGAFEQNRARRSLGNGVIMLALAGGIMGAAYASDGVHGFDHGATAPAVILGAVGLAFLLLAIFDYATKKRTANAA